ncbi:MAG TPA: glycosyltransferase [Stellaceae bacterium]|nr:glycosyltransferase [Stellaceae bacterium]
MRLFAAAGEHERSARARAAPVELLAPLFMLILGLGLCLTGLMPFGYVARATLELKRSDVLSALWFTALAGLSFFVLARWCLIQTFAFIAQLRLARRRRVARAWPLVSILVPAYQEGETIVSALSALIALDYPRYEIIVVDDGSSDDTADKAERFAGEHGRCRLTLLRKPNGGKWSALNLAFGHATGELVLCIDADSRLGPDALRRLVARMDDPRVAGVSGQITVRNRRRLLARLQAYEYVVANGGLRTAQSLFGLVLVVPGPIGLYRRRALQEIVERAESPAAAPAPAPGGVPGPFSPETFAEDFQLSLTILALGGRIVYEPAALSYTKAPDLTLSLLSQRYRWFRGTMQVLRIYHRRLRHAPGARRRRLSLVIGLIYLLDLFVLPVVNFAILFAVLAAAATSGLPADLLLWVAAIWLLNLLTAAYHVLAQGDDLSLLCLVPLYDLYHGLLLNSAWTIAVYDELRRSEMQW